MATVLDQIEKTLTKEKENYKISAIQRDRIKDADVLIVSVPIDPIPNGHGFISIERLVRAHKSIRRYIMGTEEVPVYYIFKKGTISFETIQRHALNGKKAG